jgi:hypothetical protein
MKQIITEQKVTSGNVNFGSAGRYECDYIGPLLTEKLTTSKQSRIFGLSVKVPLPQRHKKYK